MAPGSVLRSMRNLTPGAGHARGSFVTTRWSLVLKARGASPEAKRALDELCRGYWYPLYCYARSCGLQRADAEDAIQGFLLCLLQKDFFGRAAQEEGRLRAFLKSSLQKHLVDKHRRAGAWKRGGRADFIPLDLTGAEERYLDEAADHRSPDQIYDRQWALLFLDRVLDALREHWMKKDKLELFTALNPFLFSELVSENTRRLAAQFHLSEANVKQNLHRMKTDFQTLFHREVAETVQSEADIAEEIAALRAALS